MSLALKISHLSRVTLHKMAAEPTKESPKGFMDKVKGLFGKDLAPEIRRSTDIEIHTWNGPDDPENPYVAPWLRTNPTLC